MDMLQFFRRIIPAEGFKYLIEFTPTGVPHHYAFDDFELMVQKATELTNAGKAFYHACASYKEIKYNDFGYPVGRTQDNVRCVKALWQDIDVGKVDKKTGVLKPDNYATKAEAWAAVQAMTAATGLQLPLLVDSGNGLHCYWPFTEPVAPAQWLELALLARTAMRHAGFKFDTSRDVDCASILRPVGSSNKGKTVTVKLDQPERSFDEYKQILTDYVAANELTLEAQKTKPTVFENEFSGPPPEYPPSSLALIAERCNQIREFSETGGSENLWWLASGVAKNCTDGHILGHEFASKHPEYDHTKTQKKMDDWQGGPPSCATFEAKLPDGCKGCAFKDRVKHPLQLGYSEETLPATVAVEQPDGTIAKEAVPFWPRGFNSVSNVIYMALPNKDEVIENVRVCSPVFYFKDRIRTDDGTFVYTVRLNTKNDDWHEFELPTKSLAELRTLKSYLAAHEIMVNNDKLMSHFVQSYSERIRKHKDEVNTFRQFGWNKERTGFLIGTSLVHKGGRTEVRVSPDVIRDPALLAAGIVKGDKETWVSGVDELYNREFGEPYQYAISSQFGSPLVSFMDYAEWNGIPLALTSEDSGYGKSTVVKIGINALYNSDVTLISDASPKAVVGRASAMNHLPMLVDEVSQTLVDPKDLSFVLYSLSNGKPRIGMQSDGKERIPLPPYKLGSTLTGNKNLQTELTESKLNPEATQMRVFEIDMQDYPRMATLEKDSPLHADHHELTQKIINSCHGVFADDYVRFVIDNQQEIIDRLQSYVNTINRALKGNAAKERFYSYQMAQTLVGGWIAKQIGAVNFDLTNLKNWAFNHIIHMRGVANKFDTGVEDRFSRFLADLHGQILVTKHFDLLDSKRGHTEMPMIPIRGPVAARLVLGSEQERSKLYIAVKPLDDWCVKNGTTAAQFKRQLAASGLLRSGSGEQGRGFDKKVSISRGVPAHPMGQCRCLEFNYAAAQGYIEEHVQPDNVVPINAGVAPATAPEQPTELPASPSLAET
jgi:hypothetical protein